MKCIGMPGIQLEDLLIKPSGNLQTSGLMMPVSLFQCGDDIHCIRHRYDADVPKF
jgi:hypothetical protein